MNVSLLYHLPRIVDNGYPNVVFGVIQEDSVEELIANYKKEGEKFWELAVANKGHIGDFAVEVCIIDL